MAVVPETGRCQHDQELSDAYVALRWSLRDLLRQVNIPTNPGWGDSEIVECLAERLGGVSAYAHCLRDAERMGRN